MDVAPLSVDGEGALVDYLENTRKKVWVLLVFPV